MTDLRTNAQALQTLLQDPDADNEQIRELADDLAGALANTPALGPSAEQGLALVTLMHRFRANGAGVRVNQHDLPDGFLGVTIAPATGGPYDCGIAPNGDVSS